MSGIQIGPIALVVAAAAYILKKWWDDSSRLRTKREDFYEDFYTNVFEFSHTFDNDLVTDDHDLQRQREIHSQLREMQPKLQLFASYRVMEFYSDYIDASTAALEFEEDSIGSAHDVRDALRDAQADLLLAMRRDLIGLAPAEMLERARMRFGRKEGNEK